MNNLKVYLQSVHKMPRLDRNQTGFRQQLDLKLLYPKQALNKEAHNSSPSPPVRSLVKIQEKLF